ncbi:MAG: BspA family leucine-rich repeat surface protein, partial [Polaribacter sp.]|nr:BspA family leucine-rich repeat surface protein [Polaribacter sp.]
QDISNWDVSSVIDMNNMFFGSDNFNQDISNWDVSSVIDMNNMFFGSDNFNQDISNWDVSNVTRCSEFAKFSNLDDSKLPNFPANCN